MVEIPKSEKKFMAEMDARTLADSEIIKKDPVRLMAAKRQALEIAKLEKERADAMKAVAKTKGIPSEKKKPTRKSSKKKKATKGQSFNVFQKL